MSFKIGDKIIFKNSITSPIYTIVEVNDFNIKFTDGKTTYSWWNKLAFESYDYREYNKDFGDLIND